MSRYGEKLAFDANGEAECPHTGDRYRLDDERCVLVKEGKTL
jgi:hypothetical protein